jgi:hypothetical protein
MKKFYMIIREVGGFGNGVRHNDRAKVEAEVERLVRKENQTLILLEAIEYCSPLEQPVQWGKMREE